MVTKVSGQLWDNLANVLSSLTHWKEIIVQWRVRGGERRGGGGRGEGEGRGGEGKGEGDERGKEGRRKRRKGEGKKDVKVGGGRRGGIRGGVEGVEVRLVKGGRRGGGGRR